MKRIGLPAVLLSLLLVFSCNKKHERIFDVKALKGKSTVEVEKILGKPDTVYTRKIIGKDHYIQHYRKRDTEVRHYKGELVEIVVNKPFDLEFDPEIIERYGFAYEPPHRYDTTAYYRWNNLEGVKNVNVYKVGMKKPEGVKTYFKLYFNMR